MAISINSAADARYYASRMNSSRTNSSSAAKKSTSSIVSSAARAVAAATSAVKSVVKKNSSSTTTTAKKNNTNAAVNAASASVKSKTNQNKKTTTTVSSAASKVASSISKAVKTATNAVKTAAQNTKASTNAKAAAASTTKTASKNTTSSKNTTNAKAAAVNNSNTKKTTSSNNKNLANRIVNTVSTAASTVKKATSNVNTFVAAERARQEAMSKAASARAEAEAKARAAAATKSTTKTTTSSLTIGATATVTIKNTKNTTLSNKNTGKTTNTTVNPNMVKTASAVKKDIITVTKPVKSTTTYNNKAIEEKKIDDTSKTPKSEACKTSLSMALTGKHSEGLERVLNNLEKQHGTSYVAENVFKGDINKYNPQERAEQICGFTQESCIENETLQNILNNTFNRQEEKSKYVNFKSEVYYSSKKTDVSSGQKYTKEDIMKLNGQMIRVVNDNNVEKAENVTIALNEKVIDAVMTTSNTFNIDPTLIVAVMAHESRFNPNVASNAASGLMQVNNNYFDSNAADHHELIKSLGGNPSEIYDEVANIVAWGNSYDFWVQLYGEKDALKALRQGNIGSGWTPMATINANEFMDIKNQLEDIIF